MAVRGVDDDHVHAGFAQRRRALQVSAPVPTAAPTRNAPRSSLQARGNSVAFWKSLTVIMPFRAEVVVDDQHLLDAVLVQQRQHFFLRRILAHRDEPLPRRHDVETGASSGLEAQVAVVTMPTALPSRTTGTPEMFLARVSSSTSRIVVSGRR